MTTNRKHSTETTVLIQDQKPCFNRKHQTKNITCAPE